MLDSLVQLFQQVWEEGSTPFEWKDAMIVLIPKKGDPWWSLQLPSHLQTEAPLSSLLLHFPP